MDHNDQPNRRPDSPDKYDPFGYALTEGSCVVSAYDDIDGTSMFIIGAVDSDDAWIATADGTELDLTDWW